MSVKIAINYANCPIGRELTRQLFNAEGYQIIAFANVGATTDFAYLLAYDTVYNGRASLNTTIWNSDNVTAGEDSVEIAGSSIPCYTDSDSNNLPWGELGVDVVLECKQNPTYDYLSGHINAGAMKVVLCGPSIASDVKTIVYHVNEQSLASSDQIIASGDILTNAASLALKSFVNSGMDTNIDYVHIVSCGQYGVNGDSLNVLDGINTENQTVGRAAPYNITPVNVSQPSNVDTVIEELGGKVLQTDYRVPVINGGIMNLAIKFNTPVTVAEVNEALKGFTNETLIESADYICSSDVIGRTGVVCVTVYTHASSSDLVTIMVMYDNISALAAQIARTAKHFTELV